MAYVDELITRSGINPIVLGWIGSLCVLWLIDWLRGRK
jgi:hypothetical protein